MNAAYLQERINKLKAQIEQWEDAITALTTGGVLSYTLDTVQSRQVVTRQDVIRMEKALDGMYNRLCIFEARLNGGATRTARPAF